MGLLGKDWQKGVEKIIEKSGGTNGKGSSGGKDSGGKKS